MESNIESYFRSDYYLHINAKRLEHLESLGIPVNNKTVLEVGAGIGDLSHYYLNKGCQITITDCREINLRYLKIRYPDCNIKYLNMENPTETNHHDMIHCYGLLYHLSNPKQAIQFFGKNCDILFLETCVSFGSEESVNFVSEDKYDPAQSMSGIGCRPTRTWILQQLKYYFPFVYTPKTQPNHQEFPIDWTLHENHHGLARAIFIASKEAIHNELLTTELLDTQERFNGTN